MLIRPGTGRDERVATSPGPGFACRGQANPLIAGRRPVVEGGRHQRSDGSRRSVCVTQYFRGRYPDHTIAIFFKEVISASVTLRVRTPIMRFAVDFDDDPAFAAIEVRHIGADWMLTPNSYSGLAAPQSLPKQHFGQTHFATKLSGDVHLWLPKRRRAPSTPRFASGPPPRPGEDHDFHPFLSIQAWQAPLARSRTRPI